MSDNYTPIAGDSYKKRVVRVVDFLPIIRQTYLSLIVQCYFFDSDIGGFHYGPGHPSAALPLIPYLDDVCSQKLTQDETDTYPDVPLTRHELRSLQEDGNIRKWFQKGQPEHVTDYYFSEQSQPPRGK